MVNTITNIFWAVFLCLTILMSFKSFDRSDSKFSPSLIGKLWAMFISISWYSALIYMYIQGRLPYEISVWSFITFGFPAYLSYAALSFKYEFDGKSIIWFNGLFQRRIDIHDVRRIILIKEKNKIVKIEVATEFKSYRIRNDLSVADIFISMARREKIPLMG